MSERRNISEESFSGVMGMTSLNALPGLSRMRELAGISSDVPPETVVTTEIPDMYGEEDEHTKCATEALQTLQDCLPNICLKDIKVIRKTLQAILNSINESAPVPSGRKLKG